MSAPNRSFYIRIGGKDLGVKAPSPTAALARAINELQPQIDIAFNAWPMKHSEVQKSERNGRLTISIVENVDSSPKAIA